MKTTDLQAIFYKETGTECVNSQGEFDIDYVEWLQAKLLPFSPPKDLLEEEIKEQFWTDHYDEPELNDKNFLRQEGAKWMRSQLAGKRPDREFIIQKMNELVNDILCKPECFAKITTFLQNKKYTSDFIDDWADKNLMEGKENDAIDFAEWINDNGWFRLSINEGRWENEGLAKSITTKALYELFKTETR